MSSNEYVTIYGVGILDDLHNYFPELLYNSERFVSVQHILQYVVGNVHSRFDLFTYGRNLYSRRHTPMSASASTGQPATEATGALGADPLYTWIPLNQANSIDENMDASIRLLTSLFTGIRPMEDISFVNRVGGGVGLGLGRRGEFMDPVIVRPTQEDLGRATTLETLTSNSSNICSICQEEMVSGEEVRTIRACTHRFHRRCVDTWFARNTRCPVCRHDIRGTTATTAAAASPRTPPVARRQGTFGRMQQ